MALPQVLDTTDGLQIWRVTVSFWNKANMMMMMMTTTTTTEMIVETSVQYRNLTRLIDREDFIEFSRRESGRT
jgi:hypothetical protein